MPSSSLNDPIAEQAIEWLVFLRSGEARLQDQEEYLVWRHADARHEAACTRLELSLGSFSLLKQQSAPQSIRSAIMAPSSRRSFIHKMCALAGVGVATGLLVNRQYPLSAIMDDYVTATAQRRNLHLDDGGLLHMNARSAVDIAYSPQLRQISLYRGEVAAEIRQDRRLFRLRTEFGNVDMLNGRVNIRHDGDSIHLGVIDSLAKITTLHKNTLIVPAGSGVQFSANNIKPIHIVSTAETAWQEGGLEVHDEKLSAVVSYLQPYTPAIIRVDSKVADLRISGRYKLDNIPYTLDALAQTMPIAVTQTFNCWIHITPAIV